MSAFGNLSARDLRLELEALYADYIGCIDEGNLDRWPDFFTDHCVYKIIPRDNHRRGLPLATWLCESRGMLKDRVVTIRQTQLHAPRYLRHLVSGIRFGEWRNGVLGVRANYVVVETLIDDVTRIFNAGQYVDEIVEEGDRLKFKQKLCVFDSIVVPNSLIYPI
jgi:3-phenylpropionate/cinnamic acid dioxygenase small subunit